MEEVSNLYIISDFTYASEHEYLMLFKYVNPVCSDVGVFSSVSTHDSSVWLQVYHIRYPSLYCPA